MHSLFEGLGLGAQTDNDGLTTLLIAIVSHKCLEAFAVGVAVMGAPGARQRESLWLLMLYSLMTPLGIAAGMLAADLATGYVQLVQGVLTALAGGTLIYVALVRCCSGCLCLADCVLVCLYVLLIVCCCVFQIEIIPSELSSPTDKHAKLKMLLVWFGWAFMAVNEVEHVSSDRGNKKQQCLAIEAQVFENEVRWFLSSDVLCVLSFSLSVSGSLCADQEQFSDERLFHESTADVYNMLADFVQREGGVRSFGSSVCCDPSAFSRSLSLPFEFEFVRTEA